LHYIRTFISVISVKKWLSCA